MSPKRYTYMLHVFCINSVCIYRSSACMTERTYTGVVSREDSPFSSGSPHVLHTHVHTYVFHLQILVKTFRQVSVPHFNIIYLTFSLISQVHCLVTQIFLGPHAHDVLPCSIYGLTVSGSTGNMKASLMSIALVAILFSAGLWLL